jgi:general secretion pathway protein E
MTGHVVLTSLHTHNAASSIARLKDMGVEPSLLAASVDYIVAQRLARRLCVTAASRTRRRRTNSVQGRLRGLVAASTEEIFAAAVDQGMKTLRQDGFRLCLAGVSSLDEIHRVTGDRLV